MTLRILKPIFTATGALITIVISILPWALSVLSTKFGIKESVLPRSLMVTGLIICTIIYALTLVVILSILARPSSTEEKCIACPLITAILMAGMCAMSILAAYYLHTQPNQTITKVLRSTFIVNSVMMALFVVLITISTLTLCIEHITEEDPQHSNAEPTNREPSSGTVVNQSTLHDLLRFYSLHGGSQPTDRNPLSYEQSLNLISRIIYLIAYSMYNQASQQLHDDSLISYQVQSPPYEESLNVISQIICSIAWNSIYNQASQQLHDDSPRSEVIIVEVTFVSETGVNPDPLTVRITWN